MQLRCWQVLRATQWRVMAEPHQVSSPNKGLQTVWCWLALADAQHGSAAPLHPIR